MPTPQQFSVQEIFNRIFDSSNNRLAIDPTALNGLTVKPASASDVGLTVQGLASQTGDLQQWKLSTGAVQLRVVSNGHLVPGSDRAVNFGASTERIDTVYASSIDLSTQGNQTRRINGQGIGLRIGADLGVVFYEDGGLATSVMTVGGSSAPHVTISDAKNIILGSTTGTKIGTATTQKLGFFNATPVVQPSSTGETAGFTANAGTTVNDASTFTGNVGTTAYRISDIVKHLKNLGLIAS